MRSRRMTSIGLLLDRLGRVARILEQDRKQGRRGLFAPSFAVLPARQLGLRRLRSPTRGFAKNLAAPVAAGISARAANRPRWKRLADHVWQQAEEARALDRL